MVGGEWKIGMSWDADACGRSCDQMIDGTQRVGVRSGRVAGGDEHRNHETTCVWSRSTGKLSMTAGMVIFFFFWTSDVIMDPRLSRLVLHNTPRQLLVSEGGWGGRISKTS